MKPKKLFIFFIVLIAIILLFDKVIMPWYVRDEIVKTPNVTGMTLEQARVVLSNAGLVPVDGGERFDNRFPKGTVILQKPKANQEVKIGRRVYLIISSGNVLVNVPDFRYKSLSEANILVTKVGLTLGDIIEDTLTEAPKGLIVNQSIPPGEKVEKGSVINFHISSGSLLGEVEVPNLVGKSFNDGRKIIEAKGLTLGKIIYQPSIDLLPNTIVYQNPQSGSHVPEGTRIDLIVVKEKINEKEIIE